MDISTYMSAINQRSDYLGQIKGMFEMLRDTNNSEEVAHQLLCDHLDKLLDTALKSQDPNSLNKPLQLMTAFFIFSKGDKFVILRFLIQFYRN